MQDDYSQYELLARHLDPQFGNIYEYNVANDGDIGFDIQEWTDELRDAVRHYLVDELPPEVFDCLYDLGEGGPLDRATKASRIDTLIERLEPYEVALSVRNAAVLAVPTLHQLIGHLKDWPSEDERDDATTWLEAHGDTIDWRWLMAATDHRELMTIAMPSGGTRSPEPYDLVHALTPAELLTAWEYAVGPASTDLTDDEWQLLEHALGPSIDSRWGGVERTRSVRERETKRRTFNAARYIAAHKIPWSRLPPRYGKGRTSYPAYNNFRVNGTFARLRDALKDKPAAKGIVDWLDGIIAESAPKKRALDSPSHSSLTK